MISPWAALASSEPVRLVLSDPPTPFPWGAWAMTGLAWLSAILPASMILLLAWHAASRRAASWMAYQRLAWAMGLGWHARRALRQLAREDLSPLALIASPSALARAITERGDGLSSKARRALAAKLLTGPGGAGVYDRA